MNHEAHEGHFSLNATTETRFIILTPMTLPIPPNPLQGRIMAGRIIEIPHYNYPL
jgi:hypothetical protein